MDAMKQPSVKPSSLQETSTSSIMGIYCRSVRSESLLTEHCRQIPAAINHRWSSSSSAKTEPSGDPQRKSGHFAVECLIEGEPAIPVSKVAAQAGTDTSPVHQRVSWSLTDIGSHVSEAADAASLGAVIDVALPEPGTIPSWEAAALSTMVLVRACHLAPFRPGNVSQHEEDWNNLVARAIQILEPRCHLLTLRRVADLMFTLHQSGRTPWMPRDVLRMVRGACGRAIRSMRTVRPYQPSSPVPSPPPAGNPQQILLERHQRLEIASAASALVKSCEALEKALLPLHPPKDLPWRGAPPVRPHNETVSLWNEGYLGIYAKPDKYISRIGRLSVLETIEFNRSIRHGADVSTGCVPTEDVMPVSQQSDQERVVLLPARNLSHLSFICYTLARLPKDSLDPPAQREIWDTLSVTVTWLLQNHTLDERCLFQLGNITSAFLTASRWLLADRDHSHALRLEVVNKEGNISGEELCLPDSMEAIGHQGWIDGRTATASNSGFRRRPRDQVVTGSLPSSWDIMLSVMEGIALEQLRHGPDVDGKILGFASEIALGLTLLGYYHHGAVPSISGQKRRHDGASLLFK